MQYPLLSEYRESILDAEDNFDKLAHLHPVFDDHGDPVMSSGNFAVVFKMTDGEKFYAVKCFTKEQEGRTEAYHLIADELECVGSSYITSIKYFDKELFVDSNCDEDDFPILLMDWIEGESMEKYIADNYQDSFAMSMLCYRFCKMAAWLRSQPFAHGDLKPDNIMIRPDGSLTLVDYDGMYVPAMKGQKSPAIGTKNFSHPLRTIDDFDETIDDLALASIALSLKAISLKPSLYDEYCVPDRLLFSAEDYLDLSKSIVLRDIQKLLFNNDVVKLLSLLFMSLVVKELSTCSFQLFRVNKPQRYNIDTCTYVLTDNQLSCIEEWYLYKDDTKWIVKAILKSNSYIRESILEIISNEGIPLDAYSISLINRYSLGSCDCFYLNTKSIDIENMNSAKILPNAQPFGIYKIHWGVGTNSNKWKTCNIRSFTIDEKKSVENAIVVSSQYGPSVCFHMKQGGLTYIPLSDKSSKKIDEHINLDNAKLITLFHRGERNIYRVVEY